MRGVRVWRAVKELHWLHSVGLQHTQNTQNTHFNLFTDIWEIVCAQWFPLCVAHNMKTEKDDVELFSCIPKILPLHRGGRLRHECKSFILLMLLLAFVCAAGHLYAENIRFNGFRWNITTRHGALLVIRISHDIWMHNKFSMHSRCCCASRWSRFVSLRTTIGQLKFITLSRFGLCTVTVCLFVCLFWPATSLI